MSSSGGPLKEGFSGMKLPSLIKQLRAVLDQYPDDGQILKELIQNAEDADATEVKILYDGRTTQPTNPAPDIPHLESLKGPGLCVYNDGLFKEEDWEGIRMLHSSVKEQEPFKVGRFGLGFKSVFHITDVPLIISGEKILFIDPHIFDEDQKRVCFMRNLDNVGEFKESLLNILKGTFGFSEQTLQVGYFSGTLFWFPLRSKTTELSDNVYNNEKLTDLFKAFQTEAPHMLLFLKSLSKIEVYQKNASLFGKSLSNGNMVLLFTVDITSGNDDDINDRQKFASSIRQLTRTLPPKPIETKYYLKVETEDLMSSDKPMRQTSTWLVIQRYEGEKISKSFKKLCFDKTISSCPCVGLAVALEEHHDGHIFCFLPLPLESRSPTGLPLHVHGYFALSQNRRHLKWPTADQKKNRAQTDKAIRWNQCLLMEVFPQAYVCLIQEMIEYWERNGRDGVFFRRIYETLPVISNVTEHWEGLCKTFYKLLFGVEFLYTPNAEGAWVGIRDSILLSPSNVISQQTTETLIHVYKTSKKNITEIPDHLYKAVEAYFPDPIKPDLTNLTFVTPRGLCDVLKSKDLYQELTRQQKLDILEYICRGDSFQCLDGVQLLPLADGSFASFGQTDQVFICNKLNDIMMFPGLEKLFIQPSEESGRHFNIMAKQGVFKIEMLDPGVFILLLKQSLDLGFPSGNVVISPTSPFNTEWLDCVWQYITENEIDVQGEFLDVPIIPGDTHSDGTLTLHKVSSCFICMDVKTVGHLDEKVGSALKHFGVIPLSRLPDVLKRDQSRVLGTIINYPSPGGLVKVLEEIADKTGLLDLVSSFNQFAKFNEKLSFIESLKDFKSITEPAKMVLTKLELFACTGDTNDELNTSLDELNLLEPSQAFPVAYPSVYIHCPSDASSALSRLLGAQEMTLTNVITGTLKLIKGGDKRYTKEDIKTFMMFLLKDWEQYFKDNTILKLAKDIKFLETESGTERVRACDLFEPCPVLRKLFLHEDVFPAAEYLQPIAKAGLKVLGLRSLENITEVHLCNAGTIIENLLDGNETQQAVAKGQALLAYIKQNIKRLNVKCLKPLRHVKFVPCKIQRTDQYPETLTLYAEEKQCSLERLENVWNAKHLYILGSVSLVANDLSENILKAFNLPFKPPLALVLNHFEHVIESYHEDNEDKFRTVITDVYKYLSEVNPSTIDQTCKKKLVQLKYVFVSPELGFKHAKGIWIKKSKSDIDLRPYRYCLPKLLNQIGGIISVTGGKQSQTPDMLVDVLLAIRDKHDKARVESVDLTDDLQEDLGIISQIANKLKLEKQRPKGISLPVHQDDDSTTLLLKPVEDCTYCNAEWLKDQTVAEADQEEDTIYFVHRDISEDTALKLGVASLTERVMDGTEALDLNYGQKEVLTQRLHNLLQGYTPYSIPKEMIQNAEDAGASKVMFLYDERQNHDARTSLMNEAMASLQGPAFWVYNDARFTNDDFKNIQNLGGATKKEDESKIGRYGLGFNSVYNLTDVPSFISGNTIVLFDPHETYLGKPGLKADLTSVKNRRMLQAMKGQFKPYDGVFGCDIERQGNKDICQGTLFRFPLRTPEQAEKSKISDVCFTKAELKVFLNDLAKGAGNLLLFTHHVKSVEIYYLQKDSLVSSCHLLLTVEKNSEGQFLSSENDVKELELCQSPIEYLKDKSEIVTDSGTVTNDYLIENVEVVQKTTDDFLQYFGTGVQNSKTNWRVTWTRGKTKPDFAQSTALHGLVPLGTTAVPLEINEDILKIGQLSDSPEGFYNEGRLFSFFPLPLPPTLFEMHVSAQFALTEDRQHLCEPSDEHSVAGAWNKFLEKEVISRAMVLTLEGLKDISTNDVTKYYHLWPQLRPRKDKHEREHISKPDIVKCFYKIITEEDPHVFVENDSSNVVSFKDVLFLAPSLAYNEQIGKIAVKLFQRCWKRNTVIDLPKDIFEEFMSAGLQQAVNSHVMTRKTFYEHVFFPNMANDHINKQDCEKLTIHAIMLCDPDIDELLKSQRCIPTKPDGDLKRPEELIHPCKNLSKLYSPRDRKFPEEVFSCREVLERLCSLGMKDTEIPWKSFTERIYSVRDLFEHERNEALERCLYILQYLNESGSSHKGKRFADCPDIIRNEIRAIPFLPVLCKPRHWPFSWLGENEMLAEPTVLFFDDDANIVGCVGQVLDSNSLKGLFSEKEVLKWLGVQGKETIPAAKAKDQLMQISTEVLEGVPVTKESTQILHSVYKHLDDLCRRDTGSFQDCQHVLSTLHDKDVILHDKTLVCPHKVAFHLGYDLQPFLFKLEHSFGNSFRKLFQAMGIEDKFTVMRVKEEIDNITTTFQNICMTNRDVRLYVDMIRLWLDLSKDEESRQDHIAHMMLPDSSNNLKRAQSLCLDDCDWISKDPTMLFVHSSISKEVALKLKVKTKRHANIETLITPFEFGQSEKLTSRLKGILQGYPRDSSIMKELLQNADDAGATELMFIKDFRNHPTERIFDEKWKPLQGPALCVWNNSSFSQADFKGIQALGEGSKSNDPLKTGQYGVGFNAVYHLTDVPSFLTFGPDTPETLCIFDPNLKYVPWAKPHSPGCRFPAPSDVQQDYRDVFACYLKDVFDMGQKGTLFRLPLRTQEMANLSDISNEYVPVDGAKGIKQLLTDFQTEMMDSLLFLHSVRKISIHSVTNAGKLIEEFSVTADMSEEHENNVEKHKQDLKDHKDRKIGRGKVTDTEIILETHDSSGKKQKWIVVHQSGFSDYNEVPGSIKDDMNEDGRIGMLPRGGVAIPLEEKPDFKGRVFCILPLRITTGLPLHVNGHFALDHEARGNLWHGPHPYRTLWNENLIKHVIVPAYVKALTTVTRGLFESNLNFETATQILKTYNNLFPLTHTASDDYWRLLARGVYEHIVKYDSRLFPVVTTEVGMLSDTSSKEIQKSNVKIEWVTPTRKSNSFFNNITNQQTTGRNDNRLVEILKAIGMKIIDMPLTIYCQFEEMGLQEMVVCTSPNAVIEFLKTHSSSKENNCEIGILPTNIKETTLRDTYSLVILTKYCQSQNTSHFVAQLDGLPLLLTQDSMLRCFDSRLPTIVTKLTNLVKDSPEKVMHVQLVDEYISLIETTEQLQRLDIQTFSTILPKSMGHLNSTNPFEWNKKAFPYPKWILQVWKFLRDEIEYNTKKKRPDAKVINQQLTPLRTWCLLPVFVKTGTEFTHYLYPIQEANKILNLVGQHWSAFSKISIPQLDTRLDTEIFQVSESLDIAKDLVANLLDPVATLRAVAHAKRNAMIIDIESGRNILKYFCDRLTCLEEQGSMEIKELLRSLTIFEGLSGSQTDIRLPRVYGVRKYEDIPQEGVDTWSDGLRICLLKCSGISEGLFKFLGFKIIDPGELYESFILANFPNLPTPARAVHLKYVRDHLLHMLSSARLRLTECLKSLSFIEDKNGVLHKACEYFSKEQDLFAKFWSEEKFPPSPYDKAEWKDFLKTAGIVTEVSPDHFVTFARMVEQENVVPLSKDTKSKSRLLVNHLFEHRNDLMKGQILTLVKDIKFVMPHQMDKDSQQSEMIKQIHPQFQQGKLISYSGSVSPEHCDYVWTSCAMFEHHSDPDYFKFKHNLSQREKIVKKLGVQRQPRTQSIVEHADIVCRTLEQKQKAKTFTQGSLLHNILLRVMDSIYKHLFESWEQLDTVSQTKLKSLALVFLPEGGLFVRAKEIILEMASENVIKGYMYKAPPYFGRYVEFFQLLGAAEHVTANHYANILQMLSLKTHDTKLEPNELVLVQKVTHLLFKCHKKEVEQNNPSLTVPYLYLLNRDQQLAVSTQLVVADSNAIEERVHSLKLRYFVGFQKLKISVMNEKETFAELPSKYRPVILSEATTEIICNECRQSAHQGPLSEKYKTHISHQEFRVGVIRLINDQRCLANIKAMEETELREIEEKIVSLDIKEVEGLTTVLVYNGHEVKESKHSQPCVLDTSNDGQLTVYLNASTFNSFINQKVLPKFLAMAINTLIGSHLTTLLRHLETMFECPLDKIKKLLDKLGVLASSYISSHVGETVFPYPGTYIPEEFHWMLDNSFCDFDENDYVGLEIYDPLTDDALQGDGQSLPSAQKGPIYIYAKVKKIIEKGKLPIHARYLIDTGESEAKEVSALDLYKFCRTERPQKSQSQEVVIYTRTQTNTGKNSTDEPEETESAQDVPGDVPQDVPQDMGSVLKEIRETLKEAWNNMDKCHRDKVKKRLLFKWHPDKNKGNEEFCTKVFQKIQNYIEMLEKGRNIDEDISSNTAPKPSRSNFDEWFYEEMRRRSRQHRDNYEHQRSRNHGFNFEDFFSRSWDDTFRGHRSAREDPHPQPEEAKRWMRQAKEDLKVARTTLQVGFAYNWSCFQCYMASEKAVKALLYNHDAKEGERYKTEDLRRVVHKVKQTQIQQLVLSLISIVTDANKMQYPTKLDFPRIPSEKFTEANARETCRLTDDILQKADEIIG